MNRGGRAAFGSLLLAVAVVACGSSGRGTPDAATDGADGVDAADAADAADGADTRDAADAAAICNNCGMVGMVAEAGSCTFSIPCPSGDFSRLFVFEDGTSIPRDTTHQNGWDFTDAASTHVQIYGEACAAITNGTITATTWAYGCGSSP